MWLLFFAYCYYDSLFLSYSCFLFRLTLSLRSLFVLLSSEFRLPDLYLHLQSTYPSVNVPSSAAQSLAQRTQQSGARASKQHYKHPTLVCTCNTIHTAVWSPILLFAYFHRTNERPPRPPNVRLPCCWSLINYFPRIPYLPCDISILIQRLLFPAFRRRPCHT